MVKAAIPIIDGGISIPTLVTTAGFLSISLSSDLQVYSHQQQKRTIAMGIYIRDLKGRTN